MSQQRSQGLCLDSTEIQAILPHRYPFLLVDRIEELEIGKRVIGIKSVTVNEPFFQGHLPGKNGSLTVTFLIQIGRAHV